jgi:predicted RNase H-like HicB family nuclease
MKLTIVLEEQEEGGFTVFVPALPGCISEGETREEAIENIREAIALYLESGENENLEYPGDTSRSRCETCSRPSPASTPSSVSRRPVSLSYDNEATTSGLNLARSEDIVALG